MLSLGAVTRNTSCGCDCLFGWVVKLRCLFSVDSEGVFVWVFCVCGKIEYAGILDGCTMPERWLEMVVVMGTLEGF
jgi:hypothetical protein